MGIIRDFLYGARERIIGRRLEALRSELEAELDAQKVELKAEHKAQKAELESEIELLKSEIITQRTELKEEIDEQKTELQKHRTDSSSYDHESIRVGYDYLFANIQLAVIELICPWNRARLEALKDSHKGEHCFVIGNGPSLLAQDLSLLRKKGIFCFASNLINLIFDKTEWRPDVWGIQDRYVIQRLKEDYSHFDSSIKIASGLTVLLNNTRIPDAVYFPHIVSERLPFWFNKDITKGIMDYPTITGALINIAAYMGFSIIYLLGVDNTTRATKLSADGVLEYDYSTIKHFTEQYWEGTELVLWEFAVKNKDRVYQDIKASCEHHNIKIYNATRGGELEIFERICFEDTLRNESK